jgi:hypothetical protein
VPFGPKKVEIFRIQVKISELYILNMEPRRAVDIDNGGAKAQNRALECLKSRSVVGDTYNFDEEQDLDPH